MKKSFVSDHITQKVPVGYFDSSSPYTWPPTMPSHFQTRW